MKRYKKNIKLIFSLSIITITFVTTIIIGLSIYFERFYYQEKMVKETMQKHVENLHLFLQYTNDEQKKEFQNNLNIAKNLLYKSNDGIFVLSDSLIDINNNKGNLNIKVPAIFKGNVLINSDNFIGNIAVNIDSKVAILQNTSLGYVAVSSNILKFDGTTTIGTYLDINPNILNSLKNGKTYMGNITFANVPQNVAIEPILINNNIEALLVLAKTTNTNISNLENIFNKTNVYKNDRAFLLSKKGSYLLHPFLKGKNIANTEFYKKLLMQGHTEGYLEDIENGELNIIYYKYFQPYQAYIGIAVNKKEAINDTLTNLIVFILITIILIGLVLYFIITKLTGYIINPINYVSKIITELSKGSLAAEIDTEIDRDDEIGNIIKPINLLIQGIRKTTNFALEIGKGNFDTAYEPMSKEDTLGNALISMRDNLKLVTLEDKQRNWITSGQAQIGDILRQQMNTEEELYNEIISFVTKYLKANQGSIFLINEDNPEEKFIELVATYAYSKRKYITKRMEIDEGLVGQCVLEGDTLFITDVPDSFINITSGLGDANPSCIVIVPLKVNDKIHGVIEIASFKIFEKYEIEFIEKLSESIASTISNLKINITTRILLETTQQQTEQMRSQEEEMRQNLAELAATQDKIKRNNVELENTFNAMDAAMGVIEYDLDGTIVFVNKYITDILEKKAENIIGTTFNSLSISENNIDNMWNEVKAGILNKIEKYYIVNDSKKVCFQETYSFKKDPNGNIIRIMASMIDITDAKVLLFETQQQNEEMRAQEEEMRQNLEELAATQEELERQKNELLKTHEDMEGLVSAVNNSIGSLGFDINGKILGVNDLGAEIIGYSDKKKLKGELFSSLLNDESNSINFYDNLIDNLSKGKIISNTLTIKTKDGNIKYLKSSFSPIKNINGQFDKVFYLFIDVTENKRLLMDSQQQNEEMRAQEEEMRQNLEELAATQEDLHRREEQLNVLTRNQELIIKEKTSQLSGFVNAINSTVGSIMLDRNHIIIDTNENFEELLGYSKSALKGQDLNSFISDKYKEIFAQNWKNILNGEVLTNEISMKKENGENIWLRSTFNGVHDDAGNIVNVLNINIDITTQITLNEQITDKLEQEMIHSAKLVAQGKIMDDLKREFKFKERKLKEKIEQLNNQFINKN